MATQSLLHQNTPNILNDSWKFTKCPADWPKVFKTSWCYEVFNAFPFKQKLWIGICQKGIIHYWHCMQGCNIGERNLYPVDRSCKLNIDKMLHTSSECLIYIKFMSCGLEVIFRSTYRGRFPRKWFSYSLTLSTQPKNSQ